MSSDPVGARLRTVLDEALARRPPRRVLDVGCGFDSEWSGFAVPSSFRDAHVVGMDMNENDLRRNELLDDFIVGDVQRYALPQSSFDAIVCWNVLEHVSDPVAALDNLERALAPEGLLILGFPNLYSLKGLVTKLTPFRVHVWLYRRYFGVPDAGTPGVGPFPTYLRTSMSPERIKQFASERGLAIDYHALYGADSFAALFPGRRVLAAGWRAALVAYRVATLGRVDPSQSEAVFVLRKP